MEAKDIKLKNPKSCNHCPAFNSGMSGMQGCSLGYETEMLPEGEERVWHHFTSWEDLYIKIKPAEPCPKPKNTHECVDIRAVIDIHRYANPESPEYKAMGYDKMEEMTKEEALACYVRAKKL